jgi:hypothetical protein
MTAIRGSSREQLRLRPAYEGHVGKMVKHGDEVSFVWSEPRPSVCVTFHKDGTYTVHGADPAPDANNFWDPDEFESSGDSLKFLAELTLDEWGRGQFALEEEMTICCNVWETETWRAVVTEADFRFEPVTTLPDDGQSSVEQGDLPL